QAFIHVNCAMLPPERAPEIFSQPAASAKPDAGPDWRLSLVELATHGTLYLEEIQRLPGELQAQLAAVLERGESSRERGEAAIPDVRVIAYSSAPLATASGLHPKLLTLLERRQLRVPSLAARPAYVGDMA